MRASAKDIIGSLFNPDEDVCLRVFADRKGDAFTGCKINVEAGKFSGIEDELKKHNAQNRGIFYVVNYGGQDDKSITRINAQFVECDSLSIDEQKVQIDAFELPPSLIIKTKKSLHTYWFIKEGEVAKFRIVQKQLIKKFHGDPMCVNESRVLRLPGFNHCKEEPIEVECLSFHPERKYTQDELLSVLPKEEGIEIQEKKKGSEKGLNVVMHGCDFIKHCRNNAAILSENDWYAMITNLSVFDKGVEMVHELSKAYPNYDFMETQKKINHFLDSQTRPITCKKIMESGFICPKKKDGKCDCKAPAALCYRPMREDGLKSMIEELPITNKTATDMKTARAFVEDYLYNQDSVTASFCLNYEIKDHFKFNGVEIKSLENAYRIAAKEYSTGLRIRKVKMEEELPKWYEPTKSGLKFMPGVLAEEMAKNEKAFFAAEQHYAYKDGVYHGITELEAQHMCQKKMIPRETKMSQIVDAENQWKMHMRKDVKDLNANPYIINLRNGLYNVLEDTLTEHTPKYLSTMQLSVKYDKESDCPMFKKFLKDSMDGDMEQVTLIQEMLGYFLIPTNAAQKSFVIVGAAGAGKSVLLRVINELLLGRENVSNVSWQSLNERFKTAELFGKLANIFADLPTKNIDDNGIFKALVGEDYLTVEKKNKNPFSFQSTARLLFSCNSIPKNYGDRSEGFYRRLIIIRFARTVPKEKRDPYLLEKFKNEIDGIFQFALEGLKRLMRDDYKFCETAVNEAELQQYREDSDSVLSFVKECCVIKEDSYAGSTELFNAYKAYCEECGLKPCAHRTFVGNLTTSYISVERGKDGAAF
jgi:putative DNA primase/helicase